MVLHHLRGVLDRVARLFVGPSLLQDVGGEHVADVVRPMRQEPRDRASPCEGIVDPVALYRQPPRFVESGLVVGSVRARPLDRLHEERAGVLGTGQQDGAMARDISVDVHVEPAEVRQDQSKRLAPEIRRRCVFEGYGRDQNFPAVIPVAPAQLAALMKNVLRTWLSSPRISVTSSAGKRMPFQILALSGGGYRGLFSAHILAKLEEQAGRPIGECFDLIAGTSIGGIIATGLALGKSAKEIRDVFEQRGEDIFTRGEPTWNPITKTARFLRGIVKPKYDGTELRKAIEDVVGADTVIGDAKTRLLVPTVNMTKGSVQLFKTAHHPDFFLDHKVKAADVVMATSAAPTFFPMAKIGAAYFVDGGVVANAPDLCAIHEATQFLEAELDDIRVLSIGTITTGFSLPTSLGGRFGIWSGCGISA